MIDPDAEPLFNVSPYPRIDIKGRPVRITNEQALMTVLGGGKDPDLTFYNLVVERGLPVWILKEGA